MSPRSRRQEVSTYSALTRTFAPTYDIPKARVKAFTSVDDLHMKAGIVERGNIAAWLLIAALATSCAPNAQSSAPGYYPGMGGAGLKRSIIPGCGWVTDNGATYTSGQATLNAIDSVSVRNVWAVGDYQPSASAPQLPLAEHWNGSAWSFTYPPSRDGMSSILAGDAAISPTKQWAVGDSAEVANSSLQQTLVEKWTGSAWTVVSSPNVDMKADSNILLGVAAWGPAAAIAVGDTRTGSFATRPLALSWNGSKWSIVHTPTRGTGLTLLVSVAGVSATDAWAVGQYGTSTSSGPLAEHWNGSAWKIVPMPIPSGSTYTSMTGVTTVASDDVWAVGSGENGNTYSTLVEHWNGSAWTIVPSPNVAGTTVDFFNGASHSSPDNVWAAGQYSTSVTGPYSTLVEHWNGSTWSIEPTQNPSTNSIFYGVAAADATDVWAAGQLYPASTLVETYCR